MQHEPHGAQWSADILAQLRRELSAAIMAESWSEVVALDARIRELDPDLEFMPADVPALVAEACRRYGTLRVSQALGFSRQAVLAVAAGVQGNGGVLVGVQLRIGAGALRELDQREAEKAAAREVRK